MPEHGAMGYLSIVSGTLKGRKVRTPPGMTTRPLLSRLRKSLADILRPRLAGARVLDLFGGSGAIAFELLSNGADRAVIVERDPQAARLIGENARSLGLAAAVDVRTGDGISALAALERRGEAFDIIILAPPYGRGLQRRALEQLSRSPVPAPGGIIVAQREAREEQVAASGMLACTSSRRYGRTVFDFYALHAQEKTR